MRAEELDVVEAVGLLRQVTAELIGSVDLDQALTRLAHLAARSAPDLPWCGISLLRDGDTVLAAHTAEFPVIVEDDQYRRGEGPCLTAIGEREIVISSDLTTERRWPGWCRLAVGQGVRAVASYPLTIDNRVSGALNLYRSTAAELSRQTHFTALLITEQAGLLLNSVLERGRMEARIERLRRGGNPDRADVDRAVGILLAQRGCDVDEAYTVLEEAAVAVGADLPTVSAKLVSTVVNRGRRGRPDGAAGTDHRQSEPAPFTAGWTGSPR